MTRPAWSLTRHSGVRGRSAGTWGSRARCRRVVAAALVVVPLSLVCPLAVAGAGRDVGGPLHNVRCGPVRGDPAVQAPPYAEAKGATSVADGWWCQLPHATALPAGFVAIHRYVGTLPNTYADYITQYAPKGTTSTKATTGPVITLVADASSGVFLPKHLHHLKLAHGRKVRVARGVEAMLSTSESSVNLTWRFPTAGVPGYLVGVVSVSVGGHDVPEKTVVAVAERVKPD